MIHDLPIDSFLLWLRIVVFDWVSARPWLRPFIQLEAIPLFSLPPLSISERLRLSSWSRIGSAFYSPYLHFISKVKKYLEKRDSIVSYLLRDFSIASYLNIVWYVSASTSIIISALPMMKWGEVNTIRYRTQLPLWYPFPLSHWFIVSISSIQVQWTTFLLTFMNSRCFYAQLPRSFHENPYRMSSLKQRLLFASRSNEVGETPQTLA